jgi:hypothetical protein
MIDLERHRHFRPETNHLDAATLYKGQIPLTEIYAALWELAFDCRNDYALSKSNISTENAHDIKEAYDLRQITKLRKDFQKDPALFQNARHKEFFKKHPACKTWLSGSDTTISPTILEQIANHFFNPKPVLLFNDLWSTMSAPPKKPLRR